MKAMDALITLWIQGLKSWSLSIADKIADATWLDLALVTIIPVLALVIGALLNHRIDQLPKATWKTRVIDFVGPLLSPFLSALFFGFAIVIFHALETTQALLYFGFKLSVAWLAMRGALLMTSRKTAGWLIALVIIPITLLHFLGLWSPITGALKAIKFTLGTVKLTAFLVVKTLLAIVVLFWISGFVVDVVDRRIRRMATINISTRTLISKIFQILLYFIVFIVIMQILGINLTALSIFGGALGVGLGFGLQNIASNFVSGIILLFEKSVQVGDMIELTDGTVGTVRQTSARYTLIETIDAREVLIPNADFISQRMVNWTYSNKRARATIPITVAYGTDLERAQELMLSAARVHPKCLAEPAPSAFVTGFADHGITMTLYFWVADVTDGRLEPTSDIMIALWKAFQAEGITLPYPRRDVYVTGNVLPTAKGVS
jgi:small-conductance mechanosensitive channel